MTYPSNREVEHDQLLLKDIKPSPENDELYRPVDPNDPQVMELAESIRKFGLREPLVLTTDGYILSGHRRFVAAQLAGLTSVPVRYEQIKRSDANFVPLLREHNRQREKSLDEKLREEIVSLCPELAHARLIAHRKAATKVSAKTIKLDACRERRKISAAKDPLLEQIVAIINSRRAYWPLSDRAIHYALLNTRPLKHAQKPNSQYDNTLQSYKCCVDLLTRGRLTGKIPMSAISDETRPVKVWNVSQSAGKFFSKQLDTLGRNYWRDLMKSQPCHIELLVEKNTVEPIVSSVAARYTIPVTSGRGFCSIPPRQLMATRFKKSGKDRMILIVASDFDPEGESICESFARSMRDDFSVEISCIKAALTYDQTLNLDLPPALKAKESSSRYGRFKDLYGDEVYELEALEPETLKQLIDEAVRSVIDINLFNKELEKEKTDAQWLDIKRQQILKLVAQLPQ